MYHVPQIVQPTSVLLSLVQLLASVFSINLLLRKASPLQVIQNSATSNIKWHQCDIGIDNATGFRQEVVLVVLAVHQLQNLGNLFDM